MKKSIFIFLLLMFLVSCEYEVPTINPTLTDPATSETDVLEPTEPTIEETIEPTEPTIEETIEPTDPNTGNSIPENSYEEFRENGLLVKKTITYAEDGSYVIFWQYHDSNQNEIRSISECYTKEDILTDTFEWYIEDGKTFTVSKSYNEMGQVTGYLKNENGIPLIGENYFYSPQGFLEQKVEFHYNEIGKQIYNLTFMYDMLGTVTESSKDYQYIDDDGNTVGVIIRYDENGNFVSKEEQITIFENEKTVKSINRVYSIDENTLTDEFITTHTYNESGKHVYSEQHKNGILEWTEKYTYDDNNVLLKLHISYFNEFDNLTREEIQFYDSNNQIDLIIETLIYFDSFNNYDYREITYKDANRNVIKTDKDYPDEENNFKELERL